MVDSSCHGSWVLFIQGLLKAYYVPGPGSSWALGRLVNQTPGTHLPPILWGLQREQKINK